MKTTPKSHCITSQTANAEDSDKRFLRIATELRGNNAFKIPELWQHWIRNCGGLPENFSLITTAEFIILVFNYDSSHSKEVQCYPQARWHFHYRGMTHDIPIIFWFQMPNGHPSPHLTSDLIAWNIKEYQCLYQIINLRLTHDWWNEYFLKVSKLPQGIKYRNPKNDELEIQ